MKVVINRCFGGFSLSDKAIKELAKLEGKQAFFFKQESGYKGKYIPISNNHDELFSICFDISNPNDFDEKELWDKHYLTSRPDDRTDSNLIKVVENLGDKASGRFAKLAVVEIPDGIDWEIDEHGGVETVHERHQSWS